MAKQDYKRLHDEEDGEDIASSERRNWKYTSTVKHPIINVIIFIFGSLFGIFLTKSHSPGLGDRDSQYSMVPCECI